MSIAQLLVRNCKQTIVYWASPTADGYGGYTFATPVEIQGRWEDKQELIKTNDGEEQVTQARVYLLQDVDEGGYLYLGSLDDLDSNPQPDEVDTAGQILAISKFPTLGQSDVFLRKVNVNMTGNANI